MLLQQDRNGNAYIVSNNHSSSFRLYFPAHELCWYSLHLWLDFGQRAFSGLNGAREPERAETGVPRKPKRQSGPSCFQQQRGQLQQA